MIPHDEGRKDFSRCDCSELKRNKIIGKAFRLTEVLKEQGKQNEPSIEDAAACQA